MACTMQPLLKFNNLEERMLSVEVGEKLGYLYPP